MPSSVLAFSYWGRDSFTLLSSAGSVHWCLVWGTSGRNTDHGSQFTVAVTDGASQHPGDADSSFSTSTPAAWASGAHKVQEILLTPRSSFPTSSSKLPEPRWLQCRGTQEKLIMLYWCSRPAKHKPQANTAAFSVHCTAFPPIPGHNLEMVGNKCLTSPDLTKAEP